MASPPPDAPPAVPNAHPPSNSTPRFRGVPTGATSSPPLVDGDPNDPNNPYSPDARKRRQDDITTFKRTEDASGPNSLLGASSRSALQTDSLEFQRLHQKPVDAPVAGNTSIGQGQIDPLRQQQQSAVNDLTAAAHGNVPSAAEIQGKQMADRSAAQQFGLAAALQGGHSAGNVLRQASSGASNVAAQARQDSTLLRANEQATARGQLTGALQGFRGQEQELSENQAGLDQQVNLSNQNSKLNALGLDERERESLLNAQVQTNGQTVQALGGGEDIQQKNHAADLAFQGQIISAGGAIGGAMASDRREKTDVRHADLDGLAEALQGFMYRYKNPGAEGEAQGERVGVMAQDALKGGPAGRALVKEEPGQPLKLDLANAIGAALAMSAEALKRSRKAA